MPAVRVLSAETGRGRQAIAPPVENWPAVAGPVHRTGQPIQGGDMNLIVWLIVGGVIGWLASIVMKTNAQMGLIANVVVGVIGAAIGGWLATLLGIGGGQVVSFILAVIGAAILIVILKAVGILR
jgi:uncharacterized membrane protein YeaQ/YmgE (transglycosylase-associated protein family)